jgi:hypothetical protein
VVEALHPEVAHDLRVAEARIDDDRGLTAEDEKPEHGHLDRRPAVVTQDEEARLELDVSQVEDLDLKTHLRLLRSGALLSKNLPGLATVKRPRAAPAHCVSRCERANTVRLLDGRQGAMERDVPPGIVPPPGNHPSTADGATSLFGADKSVTPAAATSRGHRQAASRARACE